MELVVDNIHLELPEWDLVKNSILAMDGREKKWVVLSPGFDKISPRIVATGGADGVMLTFVPLEDDIAISCLNPDEVSGSIRIWDGGHYLEYPAEYVVSKSTALQAFDYFFQFRDRDPHLNWEEIS